MLGFCLRDNSKITILKTRISSDRIKYFSSASVVMYKTISDKWREHIRSLNEQFNDLDVYCSDFCLIGDEILRTIMHISVLSDKDMIVTVVKDFKSEEIDKPTRQLFNNSLYKMTRAVRLNYDKYV